ncbi:MFS transporter [Sporichthya sp.]|uniref:MFS transporter n=1 Tax=Sporichthya sp. TaxID=65475 RepID=UPI0025DE8D84|nr:MFS transporter [Sporichthya sp.]
MVPELDQVSPNGHHPAPPPAAGGTMPTAGARRHWITEWDAEDVEFWENGGGKQIARRNLAFSVFAEHVGFAVWTMWATLVLFLGPKYGFTPAQKFTITSLPAAVGGMARLPYTLAVARFGGRNWTIVSALLLLIPCAATLFLLEPGVEYSTVLLLGALGGFGGGNFASSMANINSFYPQREKGWALGLNAAGGNLGVAVIQLIGLAVLATVGVNHPRVVVGVMIPLAVIAALCAALFMDNLATVRNDKGAMREACREPHTWVISFLYIGTFGSFIGFGFAFGQVLLVQFPETFDKIAMVNGTATNVPDPVKAAYLTFLGPLIGSLTRPLGGKLADQLGGAPVTFWNFFAMAAFAFTVLNASAQGSLGMFLVGFIGLFVTAGIGNGSTYKMIPTMFKARADAAVAAGTDPELAVRQARRRSNALIGIAGAIGAFGGLAVNITFRESFLHNKNGNAAYLSFALVYLLMAAVTWLVYLQPRRIPTASAAEVRAARALNLPPRYQQSAASPSPMSVDLAVRGTVTGTRHGTVQGALTGASLTLIDALGHEVSRTASGPGGRFEMHVPGDQRCLLVAGAPGYAALALLVEGGAGDARHHLVLAESPETPDTIAPTGCEVVGTVIGPRGPVGSALVTLIDAAGAVYRTGYTDTDGRYRIDAGEGGQVTVSVASADLHPAAGALYLRPGAHVYDVRLV